MRTAIIFPLLFFCVSAHAQYKPEDELAFPYVISDPDDWLNVREQPTVDSRIIGRIQQYEIFFEATYYCGFEDEYVVARHPDWIPVVVDKWTLNERIGYVYRANAVSLSTRPRLERIVADDNSMEYGNGTLRVVLSLKPFDADEHDIRYGNEGDEPYITEIDGKTPWGLMGRVPDNEIESLTVFQDGRETSLPISDIDNLFDPMRMSVYDGPNGELYIDISAGGGGELFSICLSVVDGVVLYATPSAAC